MRIMFPVGTKTKNFDNKLNINAQLQSKFDKEFNIFHLPLKKESFESKTIFTPKNKTKNKTKKNKK
jgi:hypothetical protein